MGCQYFDPCQEGSDSFTIAIPRVTFGRACLHEAGRRAAGLGMTRVALFTDPMLRDSEPVANVLASLGSVGINADVFDEITIEADDDSVLRGADFINDGDFDGIVSVGGGSVMDTAKAAMLYAVQPVDDFLDYFAPPLGAGKEMPARLFPHLACPTTSGTGSECTSISVLRINHLQTKFVLANPVLMAQQALI
ncbi:MAG: iron-containing alcohol dehydrogenase, partial [Pseudomonadota bacterium]